MKSFSIIILFMLLAVASSTNKKCSVVDKKVVDSTQKYLHVNINLKDVLHQTISSIDTMLNAYSFNNRVAQLDSIYRSSGPISPQTLTHQFRRYKIVSDKYQMVNKIKQWLDTNELLRWMIFKYVSMHFPEHHIVGFSNKNKIIPLNHTSLADAATNTRQLINEQITDNDFMIWGHNNAFSLYKATHAIMEDDKIIAKKIQALTGIYFPYLGYYTKYNCYFPHVLHPKLTTVSLDDIYCHGSIITTVNTFDIILDVLVNQAIFGDLNADMSSPNNTVFNLYHPNYNDYADNTTCFHTYQEVQDAMPDNTFSIPIICDFSKQFVKDSPGCADLVARMSCQPRNIYGSISRCTYNSLSYNDIRYIEFDRFADLIYKMTTCDRCFTDWSNKTAGVEKIMEYIKAEPDLTQWAASSECLRWEPERNYNVAIKSIYIPAWVNDLYDSVINDKPAIIHVLDKRRALYCYKIECGFDLMDVPDNYYFTGDAIEQITFCDSFKVMDLPASSYIFENNKYVVDSSKVSPDIIQLDFEATRYVTDWTYHELPERTISLHYTMLGDPISVDEIDSRETLLDAYVVYRDMEGNVYDQYGTTQNNVMCIAKHLKECNFNMLDNTLFEYDSAYIPVSQGCQTDIVDKTISCPNDHRCYLDGILLSDCDAVKLDNYNEFIAVKHGRISIQMFNFGDIVVDRTQITNMAANNVVGNVNARKEINALKVAITDAKNVINSGDSVGDLAGQIVITYENITSENVTTHAISSLSWNVSHAVITGCIVTTLFIFMFVVIKFLHLKCR